MNNSRSLLSFKRARTGLGLALALVVSTTLISPLHGEERVRVYSQAVQAKNAGNYEEALRLFNSLLVEDPGNASLNAEVTELQRQIAAQSAPASAEVAAAPAAPAAEASVASAPEAATAEAAAPVAAQQDPIDASLAAQRQADAAREAQARALYETGLSQYRAEDYQAAQASLDNARAIVPHNSRTKRLVDAIDSALRDSILDLAIHHAKRGNPTAARTELDKYSNTFGRDSNVVRVERSIQAIAQNPAYRDIDRISPGFTANQERVQTLLTDARAQFMARDYEGAMRNYRSVQMLDPNNSEAKFYISHIAEITTSTQNRVASRNEMLKNIDTAWMKPGVFEELVTPDQNQDSGESGRDRIQQKLNSIIIPQVSFAQGVKLSDIVETLSELSVEYDNSDSDQKGVNIIFIRPQDGSDPVVPISLRRLSLGRILDYVAEIAQFEVEIREDTVAVVKGVGTGSSSLSMATEIFQIDSATKLRMTGVSSASTSSASSNPFETASSSSAGGGDDDSTRIKNFLVRAGIEFPEGANLVYDGSGIIVTNLPRNIERIGQLLRRYEQANMVEIETKFLEVNASDLDEIGFQWTLNRFGRTQPDGSIIYDETYRSSNRSLDSAFSATPTSSAVIFGGQALDHVLPPTIPQTLDLASGTAPLASISSVIGQFDANVMINAINRKSGTDLMSAPKVTVISGKRAEIVVAQEFPYPEDYDRPEVEVGRGGTTDSGGSAGSPAVAITSGTPQNFVTRNVGVTLGVQPRVEQGNRIAMTLNPEITEFEGFVEYGGRNIALLGNTQLIAPTGYFKPIFSVRKIDTEVTIWDGATLIMGGLMREEVVRVQDKVPVLGDIPLLGFLFRSEGESSRKRNLLIFVTGNLISYGGSPSRQSFPDLERGTPFSNPVLLTPGGEQYRGRQ